MRSSYSQKPPVYSLISSRSVVEARDSAKVVDQVRFLARTLVKLNRWTRPPDSKDDMDPNRYKRFAGVGLTLADIRKALEPELLELGFRLAGYSDRRIHRVRYFDYQRGEDLLSVRFEHGRGFSAEVLAESCSVATRIIGPSWIFDEGDIRGWVRPVQEKVRTAFGHR